MNDMELPIANNNFLCDCYVIIITETWLYPGIPDAAVQLARLSLHRRDHTMDSRKNRDEGLCMYVHNDWCSQSHIIESHCSNYTEALTVIYRLFYLP